MASAGLSRSETNWMMHLLDLAAVFLLISVRVLLLSTLISLALGFQLQGERRQKAISQHFQYLRFQTHRRPVWLCKGVCLYVSVCAIVRVGVYVIGQEQRRGRVNSAPTVRTALQQAILCRTVPFTSRCPLSRFSCATKQQKTVSRFPPAQVSNSNPKLSHSLT